MTALTLPDLIERLGETGEAADKARAKIAALNAAVENAHPNRLNAVPSRSPGDDLLSMDTAAIDARRAAAEYRRSMGETAQFHQAIRELDESRALSPTGAYGAGRLAADRRLLAETAASASGGVYSADALLAESGFGNRGVHTADQVGASAVWKGLAESAAMWREEGGFAAEIAARELEVAAETARVATVAYDRLQTTQLRLAHTPIPSMPNWDQGMGMTDRIVDAYSPIALESRRAEVELRLQSERLASALAAPDGEDKWGGVLKQLERYKRTAAETIEVRRRLAEGNPMLDSLKAEAQFRIDAGNSIDHLTEASQARIETLLREADALDRVVENTRAAAEADQYRHRMASVDLHENIDQAAARKRFDEADARDASGIRHRFEPNVRFLENMENAGRLRRGTAAEYRRRMERFIEHRKRRRDAMRQRAVHKIEDDRLNQRVGLINERGQAAVDRKDYADAAEFAKQRGQEYLGAANKAASEGRIAEARRLSKLYDEAGREALKWRERSKQAA
ncbi:MAG: hypothetical protein AAF907_12335, partial [Planctomycetota bacterium]